jgi:hypothetical protein
VFAAGFLVLAGGEGYLAYSARAHQADATSLAVLQTQVADMRLTLARTTPPTDSAVVQASLTQKVLDLSAQIAVVQTQAAADHGALTQIQTAQTDLTALTARLATLNALEGARLALEAGHPLGDIPNAPPALAQFANSAPPLESALRETFPATAQTAEATSIAGAPGAKFWDKVVLRLESVITITNGTNVVFGPPGAGAVAQARTALDAGDLAGAVAALQTLSPPAQAAIADWLDQAKALLAARGALATLAQGS